MSEMDTIGCLMLTGMLLLALAASVLIGHLFGAVWGVVAFLVMAGLYHAWVAASLYRKARKGGGK